jgi:hypothetical protein
MKMDIAETTFESDVWIQLAQNGNKWWWALVDMIVKI